MKKKFIKSIVLLCVFLFVFSNVSNAILLVFELKKNDILFVGGKKIDGGEKRTVEMEPGAYKVRLLTNSKKPVHLPEEEKIYYPEDGQVVIKKELEVESKMDGEVIDLTTSTIEEDQK